MSANLSPAEQKVRKLARLPSNSICPNCGKFQKFGFSTICVKFGTFVCNECKSSHQAISHRCKSLTMSSWDNAEVDALERTGNEHARNTWLARAPPCGTSGRPQPGDDISVYKSFVVNAYERRMYYEEGGGGSNGSRHHSSEPAPPPRAHPPSLQQYPPSPGKAFAAPKAGASQPSREYRRAAPAAPRAAAPPPQPTPLAVADLLDFGPSPTSPSAPSTSLFGDDHGGAKETDDFGAFQVSSDPRPPPPALPVFDAFAPTSRSAAAAVSSKNFADDPFGTGAVGGASNNATVDAFGLSDAYANSNQTPAPPTSSASSFDFLSPPASVPAAKKPIMESGGAGRSAISGMDVMTMSNHRSAPTGANGNRLTNPTMLRAHPAGAAASGMTSVSMMNQRMNQMSLNGGGYSNNNYMSSMGMMNPMINGMSNVTYGAGMNGTGRAATNAMPSMMNGGAMGVNGMHGGGMGSGGMNGMNGMSFPVGTGAFGEPPTGPGTPYTYPNARSQPTKPSPTTDKFADLCKF